MSRRQRPRVTPSAGSDRGIGVGIQMLRVGEAPPNCPAASDEPAPSGALAVWTIVTTLGSGTCRWMVVLLGADDSEVVWAATWDGMEEAPTVVQFDNELPATGPVQLVYTSSGSVSNIVIFATQNGTTVQSEPMECLV